MFPNHGCPLHWHMNIDLGEPAPTIATATGSEELQEILSEFISDKDWANLANTCPLLHSFLRVRAPWKPPFEALRETNVDHGFGRR